MSTPQNNHPFNIINFLKIYKRRNKPNISISRQSGIGKKSGATIFLNKNMLNHRLSGSVRPGATFKIILQPVSGSQI
jgi:hypothetical protein